LILIKDNVKMTGILILSQKIMVEMEVLYFSKNVGAHLPDRNASFPRISQN
jgi:hypothetical protein